MTIAFAVVGAVILFMFAWGCAVEATVRLWDRIIWIHEDHVARKVGGRIIGESYWFSESPAAMHALFAIGKALEQNGSFRISEARDNWRRELKKATEAEGK